MNNLTFDTGIIHLDNLIVSRILYAYSPIVVNDTIWSLYLSRQLGHYIGIVVGARDQVNKLVSIKSHYLISGLDLGPLTIKYLEKHIHNTPQLLIDELKCGIFYKTSRSDVVQHLIQKLEVDLDQYDKLIDYALKCDRPDHAYDLFIKSNNNEEYKLYKIIKYSLKYAHLDILTKITEKYNWVVEFSEAIRNMEVFEFMSNIATIPNKCLKTIFTNATTVPDLKLMEHLITRIDIDTIILLMDPNIHKQALEYIGKHLSNKQLCDLAFMVVNKHRIDLLSNIVTLIPDGQFSNIDEVVKMSISLSNEYFQIFIELLNPFLENISFRTYWKYLRAMINIGNDYSLKILLSKKFDHYIVKIRTDNIRIFKHSKSVCKYNGFNYKIICLLEKVFARHKDVDTRARA